MSTNHPILKRNHECSIFERLCVAADLPMGSKGDWATFRTFAPHADRK
jgi:hypothetical protein